MKKRNLLIAASFICLVGYLPSCEILEECGTCELVTVIDGNETRSTPLPFCGEQLEEKKNSQPVTIGNETTYWECY